MSSDVEGLSVLGPGSLAMLLPQTWPFPGARQVMEEGERLSKKQLTQESTIKKLRATGKEVAADKARLEAQLAQDQQQLATTRHALETANASLQVPAGRPCPVGWTAVKMHW